MNQIGPGSFKLPSQQLNYVRIVILGTSGIGSTAEIMMDLCYRNAIVLGMFSLVVAEIKRGGFHMSNHAHRVSGSLCAHGQTVRVYFRASDAAG